MNFKRSAVNRNPPGFTSTSCNNCKTANGHELLLVANFNKYFYQNIVDDLIQLRFDEADFFLLYWVDFYVRIPDRKRKSVGSKGCVLASEMTGFCFT